jgi:hypothetical protein
MSRCTSGAYVCVGARIAPHSPFRAEFGKNSCPVSLSTADTMRTLDFGVRAAGVLLRGKLAAS